MSVSKYVVGFMFSLESERVALIRKQKPAWQRGKLNGIGGKVESGESFEEAMVREFEEETGCKTEPNWLHFCSMNGRENDDGGKFQVEFFCTLGNIDDLKSPELEKVELVFLDEITPIRKDMIENLCWLVALALDSIKAGRPVFTVTQYP